MGSYYMEATQINYRRDETLKTVDQKLQELSEESAVDTDIAPVFSKTATYNPGDMVYYKNKLYVCNTQHTGAWAAADFTASTVSARITTSDEVKADYTDLAPAFSSEASYVAGDLVTYSGTVYRCTNDHTGAWDANDFSATTISAELGSLMSGLTNVHADVKLNTQDLTTVSRSKNIVPMTLDNLKAQNTLGTWTGNAYEYNGIVWTINTNSEGQVTSITGNGTANGLSLIELWAPYKAGTYIINGAPADTPASGSYYLQFYANHVVDKKERGSGVTATLDSDATVVVRPIVPDTVQLTNVTFYPMVRLATESDATFAPYIPSVESRIEAVESGLTTLSEITTLSGIAKGVGVWTNDSFAQIAIKGVTKQFTITIQADGTLVGGVEDIT